MNELLSAEPEAAWEHIAPHLDAALGELSEPDRDALLLRYFERKSAREMAQTLGTSEDAAQKRVSRAVERLREFFAKRNVTDRRERTGRCHLRQRHSSRAGWTGRHDFHRCRSGRNNPRHHHNRNRHQNHRHDHNAKNPHHCHDRRRCGNRNLRSPPSLDAAQPDSNPPATASAAGRANPAIAARTR